MIGTISSTSFNCVILVLTEVLQVWNSFYFIVSLENDCITLGNAEGMFLMVALHGPPGLQASCSSVGLDL